ncbi:succinate dehydrogenase cytochrome b subunit [Geomesophilobacter sediminis]|uniref:Succinate dehydrogenase cytochrome b subunit n=1 Tax=Geomesophilobacter sediminis TaxID=2798584 RepID=A0A8J7SB85_9BACT|nr:succinate dehydrogenase cytochrome b subunit [Geomesophilobacter sediminis]MBJ6727656.1 succinate dehydrogenase cytochrome b subunit [Geomesophilobacter sediminis]
MRIFESSVGRKILMSITGQLMIIFVIVHLIGNSSILFGRGGINAYAEHLHALPPLVWIARIVMLSAIGVHILYGVIVTLQNRAANPTGYAVKRQLKASFASENMIWTGLLLAAFIVYHLLHFTARLLPGVVQSVDQLNRFDVYRMVVTAFSNGLVALVYALAMVVLFLHLSHGIPSFLQTMGWNNDKTIPTFGTAGKVISAVLMVGYVLIPVVILTGLLTL